MTIQDWRTEFPFDMFEKAGRAYPDFITAWQALFLLAIRHKKHLECLDINGECSTRDEFEQELLACPGATAVMTSTDGTPFVYSSIDSNFKIGLNGLKGGKEFYISYPTGFIVISGSTTLAAKACSWDADLMNEIKGLCAKHLKSPDKKRNVHILTTSEMGLQLSSIGMVSSPLEKTNYGAAVNADLAHIIDDLQNLNPCGRVVVLNGEPGCGKTYAVRGIMDAVVDAVFILVQSHMVTSLGEPSFATLLLETKEDNEGKPIICVIEDADNCLMPRAVDNVSAVSSLLNLGDGIMGAGLNIRIVATTNLKTGDLDDAVRRPGRLCRLVSVNKLSPDEAGVVYARLTGKERVFDKSMTLAEVYRLAIDENYQSEVKSKGMGFKK